MEPKYKPSEILHFMGSLTTIMHVARYSKECWALFADIADAIEQVGVTPKRLNQTVSYFNGRTYYQGGRGSIERHPV